MVWMATLALLLNSQQQPPGQPPVRPTPNVSAAPAQAQPATPPKELSGPMRVELVAIGDSRVHFWNDAFAKSANAGMRMRFMLTGERLGEVVRAGRLIIEKMVDDTGKSYTDTSKPDEEAKTGTNPVNINRQVLNQGGLDLYLDIDASPRKATKFSEITGYVNVVLGASPGTVSIRNPLGSVGQDLTGAEFAAAGLKVHVVAPADMTEQTQERGVGLLFAEGESKVKSVDYYDEWFRRMPSRSRTGKTKDGKTYTFYPVLSGTLNEDCTLVIEFFGKTEAMKIPIGGADGLKNIEMP